MNPAYKQAIARVSRRAAIRRLLGKQASGGDPKLDFPSVSDPDRKAGTEKLYKKLEAFERKHGRSKALTKALEAVLNLNHALTVAEASLYTSDENWRRNRS
jgi:hypothetical protein